MTIELPLDAVRFVKELYPRIKEDDAAIERYRAATDRLPPIVVARGAILVDGYHRWQAHRREQKPTIQAEDLGDLSDVEILRESISRNATHGQQLSAEDKRRLAAALWLKHYASMPNSERTVEIAAMLSVSTRSVEMWTKDARKYEREQQQAKVWGLWLDCLSEREIADATGIGRDSVHEWVVEKRKDSEFHQPPASRQHFDVWSFAQADGESHHFGRMPPQVVENLLWFWTEPGDIVVDPFVGGGTTIEVAKAMGRRVWASDLTPSSRLLPIHKHNMLDGWPAKAPKKAQLILLDPPYWQQANGRYSDDHADLGNMPLHDYYNAWEGVLDACRSHLSDGGRIAYIISPTLCENGQVIDHATDILDLCRPVGFQVVRRIIVPYQTQQATGQHVEWARANKRLLMLYRDLLVLRHGL